MKLVSTSQAHATGSGAPLGTWKLQSLTTQYQDNGQIVQPYGTRPHGFLHYGSDGRMYAILAHEKRRLPAAVVLTAQEKTELFDGFAAYAGTYAVDGDRISHHVDLSWNEAWTGTTQLRQFAVEGNLLRIRSLPQPDLLDGRVTVSQLLWLKVE